MRSRTASPLVPAYRGAAGATSHRCRRKPPARGDLDLNGPTVRPFVVELLFTFALAYGVLNVAHEQDHPDHSFYVWRIGVFRSVLCHARRRASPVAASTLRRPSRGRDGIFASPGGRHSGVPGGAGQSRRRAGVAFRALNPNDK